MTPTQAVAIRAVWITLAEKGNRLARAWAPLVHDVEPEALIAIADKLSSTLPDLYNDTIELIKATGSVLESESDELINIATMTPTSRIALEDLVAGINQVADAETLGDLFPELEDRGPHKGYHIGGQVFIHSDGSRCTHPWREAVFGGEPDAD